MTGLAVGSYTDLPLARIDRSQTLSNQQQTTVKFQMFLLTTTTVGVVGPYRVELNWRSMESYRPHDIQLADELDTKLCGSREMVGNLNPKHSNTAAETPYNSSGSAIGAMCGGGAGRGGAGMPFKSHRLAVKAGEIK